MGIIKTNLLLFFIFIPSSLIAQNLNDNLTLEKKPIIILAAKETNNPQSIGNRLTAIVSQKATEMGRFDIIDRRLLKVILEEQKLQFSGIISDNQIIEIGEMAAAEDEDDSSVVVVPCSSVVSDSGSCCS